jgi:hypothetical protein
MVGNYISDKTWYWLNEYIKYLSSKYHKNYLCNSGVKIKNTKSAICNTLGTDIDIVLAINPLILCCYRKGENLWSSAL